MDSTTWAPGKTRRDEQSAQGRRDHRWTHDAAPDSRPLVGGSNTNRPSLSVIAVTQLAMSQQPTVAGRGCWERPPIVGGLPRLQRSAVAQEANGISPTSSLSAMTAISRTPVLPEAARVRALSAHLRPSQSAVRYAVACWLELRQDRTSLSPIGRARTALGIDGRMGALLRGRSGRESLGVQAAGVRVLSLQGPRSTEAV
jgi:hypothetical protein